MRKREEYTLRDNHKVTDEVKADWEFFSAGEDLRLLFLPGIAWHRATGYPGESPARSPNCAATR